MDKNKVLKPIFIFVLSIFVVMLSIRFVNVKDDEKISELDKVINQYEQRLLTKDSYLDYSVYMNISLDEEDTYSVLKFSSKTVELENVIIIISNNDLCMSYGIKDSVGSDFVVDDYDPSNDRVKGVKMVFDLSEKYYIYLLYYVDGVLVEEYIRID